MVNKLPMSFSIANKNKGEINLSIPELLIIAVGLSMDAFAVAVSRGLCMKKMSYKNAIITGIFFGGFQALMPVIGYLLGIQFNAYITAIDHWIAFVLLSIIGLKMIRESRTVCIISEESINLKGLTVLAFATSVDALAVGITFAFLRVEIIPAAMVIGLITFVLSFAGVKIGNVFGEKYKSQAEIAGGIILILMGFKILFQHLGIISF